jgi:hypothetical protein
MRYIRCCVGISASSEGTGRCNEEGPDRRGQGQNGSTGTDPVCPVPHQCMCIMVLVPAVDKPWDARRPETTLTRGTRPAARAGAVLGSLTVPGRPNLSLQCLLILPPILNPLACSRCHGPTCSAAPTHAPAPWSLPGATNAPGAS